MYMYQLASSHWSTLTLSQSSAKLVSSTVLLALARCNPLPRKRSTVGAPVPRNQVQHKDIRTSLLLEKYWTSVIQLYRSILSLF